VLKKFFKRAQNEFDAKVKSIRSDNDTEFKNTQVEDYLDEEGIKHEFSPPYTSQQNEVSKRKNRTLIEMVLDGDGQYNMPCHKPSLSSLASQEDSL
jgi:transposase InsO family protein